MMHASRPWRRRSGSWRPKPTRPQNAPCGGWKSWTRWATRRSTRCCWRRPTMCRCARWRPSWPITTSISRRSGCWGCSCGTSSPTCRPNRRWSEAGTRPRQARCWIRSANAIAVSTVARRCGLPRSAMMRWRWPPCWRATATTRGMTRPPSPIRKGSWGSTACSGCAPKGVAQRTYAIREIMPQEIATVKPALTAFEPALVN